MLPFCCRTGRKSPNGQNGDDGIAATDRGDTPRGLRRRLRHRNASGSGTRVAFCAWRSEQDHGSTGAWRKRPAASPIAPARYDRGKVDTYSPQNHASQRAHRADNRPPRIQREAHDDDSASRSPPSPATRRECANDRRDPARRGAAGDPTGRHPQSVAAARRRVGLHLDPSCARSIAAAEHRSAGRQDQYLASPRQLIFGTLSLCNDCGARQRIGALVFRMTGMAAHPMPFDVVRCRCGFEALP